MDDLLSLDSSPAVVAKNDSKEISNDSNDEISIEERQVMDHLSKCVIDDGVDLDIVKTTLQKCLMIFPESVKVKSRCLELQEQLAYYEFQKVPSTSHIIQGGIRGSPNMEEVKNLLPSDLSPEQAVCVAYAQQAAMVAIQTQLDDGVAFATPQEHQTAYEAYYIYYFQYYSQYYSEFKQKDLSEIDCFPNSSGDDIISATTATGVSDYAASVTTGSIATVAVTIPNSAVDSAAIATPLTGADSSILLDASSSSSTSSICPQSIKTVSDPRRSLPMATVLYTLSTVAEGDLALVAGQVLVVASQEGDWWYGYVKDNKKVKGYFPSNYVQLHAQEDHPVHVSSSSSVLSASLIDVQTPVSSVATSIETAAGSEVDIVRLMSDPATTIRTAPTNLDSLLEITRPVYPVDSLQLQLDVILSPVEGETKVDDDDWMSRIIDEENIPPPLPPPPPPSLPPPPPPDFDDTGVYPAPTASSSCFGDLARLRAEWEAAEKAKEAEHTANLLQRRNALSQQQRNGRLTPARPAVAASSSRGSQIYGRGLDGKPVSIEQITAAGSKVKQQNDEILDRIFRMRVEDQVRTFYRKHNPSKLLDVDNILAKYKGREQELIDKLQKQYGKPVL